MSTLLLDNPIREARRTVRPASARLPRVRRSYRFLHVRSGLSDDWRDYAAIDEHGTTKHTLVTLWTAAGWRAVSCNCDAFFYFDEMCVHCLRLDECTEGVTKMAETALLKLSEEQALAPRTIEETADFALINDKFFQGRGSLALVRLVSNFCRNNRLSLFDNQVYVIPTSSNVNGTSISSWRIEASIHGLLAMADRIPEYEGVADMLYCGADEVWKKAWLSDKPPVAAQATALRKGRAPYTAVVLMKEKMMDGPVWKKSPVYMLMKAAIKQALNYQFPNNTMWRADSVIPGEGVFDTEGHAVYVRPDGQAVDTESGEVLSEPEQHTEAQFRDETPAATTPTPTANEAREQKRAELREIVIGLIKTRPDKPLIMAWMFDRYVVQSVKATAADNPKWSDALRESDGYDLAALKDIAGYLVRTETPWKPVPEAQEPRASVEAAAELSDADKAVIEAKEAEAAGQLTLGASDQSQPDEEENDNPFGCTQPGCTLDDGHPGPCQIPAKVAKGKK